MGLLKVGVQHFEKKYRNRSSRLGGEVQTSPPKRLDRFTDLRRTSSLCYDVALPKNNMFLLGFSKVHNNLKHIILISYYFNEEQHHNKYW